jgi:hypothetical protein
MTEYQMHNSVNITLEGEDLTENVHTIHNQETGETLVGRVPEDALPDCDTCPRPELGPVNAMAFLLFTRIQNEMLVSEMSGHVRGLPFRAKTHVVEWYAKEGRIDDPEVMLERIDIIDKAYCKVANARADAKNNTTGGKT